MKLPRIKLTTTNGLNLVGGAIILYLVVVLGQTVKRNYDLGHQVETMRTQITLLEEQKAQLSYGIQYYNTEAYRDREARSKLGLQLPGENVVIIPKASPTPTPAPASNQKSNRSNASSWFDFLAGRL